MKKKIHVIAHTHWDYEWYFTSNESFIQLCYHIDEVIGALENKMLDYYMLDGQMSIVEDYLKDNPENYNRFQRLVKSGKLKVGPWYTQSDQMIIYGESIVRNLQLGLEIGDNLGGADRLGYVPDAFGQSIDMPKIFYQFDIRKAVFWRGLSSDILRQREFYWESEDGSSVLAYNIKDGYFVGVQLIEQNDSNKLVNQIMKDTVSSHIALPVGGDQRYVDFDLKSRIQLYNENMNNVLFEESNYDFLFEDIINEGNSLPHINEELLNAEVSKIHRSIYSSRYDHKCLNDQVERRLIYVLEPLIVLADKLGIPYKKNLLDSIWKKALKNHAHDSAGGCNSDKTNSHILQRLVEVDELSSSLVDYLIRKISESRSNLKKNQVTLFNTLPYKRENVINIQISVKDKTFAIFHQGQEIPYQITEISKHSQDPIRKDVEPSLDSYYFSIKLALQVELDAFGYEMLDILEGQQGQVINQHYLKNDKSKKLIENEYFKLSFKDGKINLLNKKTQQFYENFIYIEDSGDDGDNYDYSPPNNDKIFNLDISKSEVTTYYGSLENSLILTGHFQVPYSQSEREENICNAKIPYKWILTLKKGDPLLHTHIDLNNKALNHRMRLMINTNVETTNSIANTPFGTITRPIIDPNLHNWKDRNWKEEPTGIYPMINFVNLSDNYSSITAFSRGVKEYEITNKQCIALTLFRSVDYLGKPDLIRRPGVASGNQFRYIETPDSQLQKAMSFSFSIAIEKEFKESLAFSQYQNCSISIPYYQQQDLNVFTNPLKYFVMHPLTKKVPDNISLIDANSIQNVTLSSIKMSRSKKGVIIRLFNPSDKVVDDGGEISILESISSWYFVTMEEKRISDIEYHNQNILLGEFKPKEIKTVLVNFDDK